MHLTRPNGPRSVRCLAGALTLMMLGGVAAAQPLAAGEQAVTNGGKIVVADRASGTLSVISVRSDELVATVELPDGDLPAEPMYVYYSPTARRVFVGDRANSRVVAFEARTFELVGWTDVGAGVFHMWGDTGRGEIWVNGDVDNVTTVIDTRTLEVKGVAATPADLVDIGGKPHDVIVGPQGRFAYVSVIGVAGPEDFVVQYDTETLTEVGRAAVGDDPHLSVTPRTDHLFVPCQGADAVFVLDRFSLDLVETVPVPGAHGAGMPDGGKYFYTANLPGGGVDALWAIDTRSLRVVGEPTDSPYGVPHNIALTPDGKRLYLTHSGANDKVTVYEVSARDPMPVLVGEVTVGQNPFGLAYVP